jgi:hypothetical protein
VQDNAFVKVAMDPTARPLFLTDQLIAHGMSQSAFDKYFGSSRVKNSSAAGTAPRSEETLHAHQENSHGDYAWTSHLRRGNAKLCPKIAPSWQHWKGRSHSLLQRQGIQVVK